MALMQAALSLPAALTVANPAFRALGVGTHHG